ncbi:unnamed protein product [Penicillium crustosum]
MAQITNIFRRLRKGIKSRQSTSEGAYTKLAELEQELSRAINAMYDLQMRLAEHDFMLAHTTSKITPTSINDIWLCEYSGSLLIDAEERWQCDEPELAMELASQVINQNPFLCELDEMRCRLFIAAVQHYLCQYEDSMMSLETVMQINTCYGVLNNPESSIMAGITYFIKGMNLMKLERFPEAYTSLTRALHIPGYSEKAREVQKQAIIGFTCIEVAEFDPSPAASTNALLDWEDSELENTNNF